MATRNSDTREETPRERVEGFIERRRHDVGEFLSTETQPDGYVKVRFQGAAYYTPLNDRVVYRDGSNYKRPPLKGN